VEQLTEGVVGKHASRSTAVKGSTHDDQNSDDRLDRRSHCDSKPASNTEASSSPPAAYSLRESCDLLQTSYDDLYDDDDDDGCYETGSDRTGVNDSPSVDSASGPLDGVHGPLNQSTGHSGSFSGPSEQSCGQHLNTVDDRSNPAFTSTSCLHGNSETSDSYDVDCAGGEEEAFRLDSEVDLYTQDVWESYYSHLQSIGRALRDREGWPNFDAVFMISAIDSDGVVDVKVNRFHLCTYRY